MKINYFDFGLHKGTELSWMVKDIFPDLGIRQYQCYGFEACQKFSRRMRNKFLWNRHVSIQHLAISKTIGTIKLFHAGNAVGHSIYASKNNVSSGDFEEVNAMPFSHWLTTKGVSLEDAINIVKINIEGAELDFFEDLVASGLVGKIDLFCGAGHDIEKVGELSDQVQGYYRMLEENEIVIHRFTDWQPERNADIRHLLNEIVQKKQAA